MSNGYRCQFCCELLDQSRQCPNRCEPKEEFKNSKEWKIGERSQRIVEVVLRETGCGFVRTHAIDDPSDPGAPSLILGEWKIVLPDLDVTERGRRFWLEVKGKTEPAFYRKRNRYQHGIDRRNWEAYQRVGEESGAPVYIVIHEQQKGNLLIQRIERLSEVVLDGEGSMTHMVYFPRDALHLWATDGIGEMFKFRNNLHGNTKMGSAAEGSTSNTRRCRSTSWQLCLYAISLTLTVVSFGCGRLGQ